MSKSRGLQVPVQRQRSVSIDCGKPISPGTIGISETDDNGKPDKPNGRRLVKQPENTMQYTVTENDTLASIAVRFEADTSELKQINRLMTSMLFTGQVLYVPTAGYRSRLDIKTTKPTETTEVKDPPEKDVKYSGQRRLTLPIIQAYNFLGNKMDKKSKKKKRNSSSKSVENTDTCTLQASYLIGEKRGESVEGWLTITPDQFLFTPNPANNEAEQKILDMVNYRMNLGDLVCSAKFYTVNPINLDRVDTSAYLHALIQETQDESQEGEGTPPQHSRDPSNASQDSFGITFSVTSPQEASSHSPQGSSLRPPASNQSLRTSEASQQSDEQVDGKTEENKKKTSEKAHKVHFSPEQETRQASMINATAALIANAIISEASAANTDTVDTASPADVTYLRVKLGQKERPTVNSLIQSSLGLLVHPMHSTSASVQPQSWARHCFAIPIEKTDELQMFLTRYYPEQLCKKALDQKEKMERKISEDKRILRRNLSVLEVCRLPLPQMSDPSELLTEVQIRILCEHLIVSADCRPWWLAYTTEKHGFSLKTLYRLCSQLESASLIVVQDTYDQVFGAMLPCSPRLQEGYYGSGESFLFKFHPVFKKFSWVGKNDYFVSGTPASLSIGGGEGQFGLWMDDDLRRGRSGKCETYNNDPLSESTDFFIKAIEVWLFPFSI